ncbi:MAG: hypothetical protein NZ530_07885 [Thermodesulfobacteriaceae bacterium]|nr:hypothetical protein [Thermodesulfobacteriaceae bacterium]MCX8041906.1 hypothetical protein [Thermodesulfobacteriaceae bacterium]MDW8136733.1 hypothetical protein [Thermodesulfobacterium sp.]
MEEKKLTEELEKIKAQLEELKSLMTSSQKSTFPILSSETFKKISDLTSEIINYTMEITQKAFLVVKGAAMGAIEGAKQSLKEEKKEEK